MDDASILVRDLRLRRAGKEVLHGVSLDIRAGEVTALVGANGAGKSSLVCGIAGALPIASGAITLGGQRLHGLPADAVRRLGVAAVPEGHRILTSLSVLDNLRAAGTMLAKAEVERGIAEALTLFPELEPRLGVAGGALSGGQKQMVGMSQALMSRPRFLLIDELSLGLAPAIVKRLAATLTTIAAGGVGILLIEQFTTLALSLSEAAYVLERGNLVFSGAAAELREHPEILHSAYLASGKEGGKRAGSDTASFSGGGP